MTTNTSQPSWTQAFRQYLRAIPKGDFHPAEPSKINRLEILCKHPLPQSYREFLELMGARPQRILGEFQGDISIDEAIEIYATEDNKPPENHLIIGSGILNVFADITLDRSSGNDPAIWNCEDYELLNPIASTFTGFLFQQAFLQWELAPQPETLKFGVPAGHLELGGDKASALPARFCLPQFQRRLQLMRISRRGQG